MRIGFDTLIEDPARPSSAINYLKTLLRTFARVAPEHEFVAFVSRANRAHFEIDASNIELVECFASNEHVPARILTQQIELVMTLRSHRIDVLHALNQVPLATRIPTVVKVCTLHHHVRPDEFTGHFGTWSTMLVNRLRLRYRRAMIDASARRATRVIANSEATRDLIVEHIRVARDKIDVVYESVDGDFKSAADVTAVRATLALNYQLSRPYILYVSNLWFYKNPDGAIRAFANQRRRYGDDLDLVIVGHDDYGRLADLRALARNEGVTDRVRFLGKLKLDALVQLYQAAHVVFYPSFAETFGKPVVEGMRSGIPVVAARAGSLPELVGAAALLVDPADPIEMAMALHIASTDQLVRTRLVEAGIRRANDFSWEKTARETVAVCARATADT